MMGRDTTGLRTEVQEELRESNQGMGGGSDDIAEAVLYMASDASNLQDLELTQLASFGDAISLEALHSHKYRLKTFYSGWVASEAIIAGWADLIPTRFARIPELLKRGRIPIDVAISFFANQSLTILVN